MAFQEIELNMIPHGDMPYFYASQYETGRPIIIDVMMGEDAFACDELYIELHCRKVDNNIVTLEPDTVDGNQVTFVGTEQLFACPGKNLCEICLYADETKDTSLGSLNFFIEVEPDPLAGGLESETQIHDLYTQVEEITEQVIGDDYYDKTEVDALLDAKADASTTYTKTEVDTALNLKADKSTTYTKTETNALLADKADASDTYTKAQVDSKLSLKADKSTTYTKTETDALLDAKADKSTTYTKTQVDNALALKANTADLATVATTGDYDDLINKPTLPDMSQYYTKAQTDALLDQKVDESEFILATGTEDELPYQTRSTPATVGNRCLEKLVGVSCGFNQQIENPTSAISVLTTDTSVKTKQWNILFIAGHKYLMSYRQSATLTSNTRNTAFYTANGYKYQSTSTDRNFASGMYYWIFNCTDTVNDGTCGIWCNAPSDDVDFDYFNLIDLTALFGLEIADYIYTLESGTAGAGVTLFRKIFSEDYYPYTANTLMSAKPTSKVIKDANNQTIATYTFGGAELRGIFKKDADGNIYADGDIYEADGTIQRRYGIVDLGTLDWYVAYGGFINTTSIPIKIVSNNEVVNAICSKYVITSYNGSTDKSLCTISGTNYIRIKDSDYNDANALKTSLSGVYLIYELATPTTETSTAYDNPQAVGATEEFTDTRTIKMPCGHDTIYSKNTDFRYW